MSRWHGLLVLGLLQTSGVAFAQAPAEEVAVSETESPVADAADAPNTDSPETDDAAEANGVMDPALEAPMDPVAEPVAVVEPPPPEVVAAVPDTPASTELEFLLRADQPGRLRFASGSGEPQEFRAPGRATLEPADYQVTWIPSGGAPELLDAAWRPSGEPVRVAHRGPSFTNLLGYWLLGNGLLVGVPVSAGIFAKRDDLGSAATFSIIGVNTLVAIVGAILMGVGDDEVIELESN